jgi:hypothetical protein
MIKVTVRDGPLEKRRTRENQWREQKKSMQAKTFSKKSIQPGGRKISQHKKKTCTPSEP